MPGTLVEPGVVRCGDLELRTGTPELAPGADVTVCVRPSALRLFALDRPRPNALRGRVLQQAYLGDHQDVRIELAGGVQVRALAPAGETYEPGAEVLVEVPPAACRIVSN
jgi:iron(III) transport system ATP-binding protein